MNPASGKVVSLGDAAALVADGDTLALGGNLLHRIPGAFARALARAGRRRLELVKTAAAYDVDLLCAAGAVVAVHAGYVGYETDGLAPAYRRGVESGAVAAREHACTTVIAALRGAAFGVPFQPVAGLDGSDLPAARGWRRLPDPYGSGSEVVVIPAIRPDWAVLHVQAADAEGNARILGAPYEDLLMARAARRLARLVPRPLRRRCRRRGRVARRGERSGAAPGLSRASRQAPIGPQDLRADGYPAGGWGAGVR